VNPPAILGGGVQVVSVQPSLGLREYTRQLADRADRVRRGEVTPDVDNLLKITSDGRKASVYNNPPGLWPAVPTKLEACADRVWRHYCESDAEAGAQLVFCDLYTPKTSDKPDESYLSDSGGIAETDDEGRERLGVYGRFKSLLISRGVTPGEVCFAHDYQTPRLRASLHAAVRAGEVRVCLGSTPLIGIAVNVQDRGVALHNLDCPWRPDELEQRIKRFVRPGNRYREVGVYVYVTEGSYDPIVWQIVEQKARFVAQLMTGRVARRLVEDVGAVVLTASLAKAVALGDDRVLAKTRLEVEIGAAERRWLSWISQRAVTRRLAEQLRRELAAAQRQVALLSAWKPTAALELRLAEPGKFTLGGEREVSSVQDGDAAVRALLQRFAHLTDSRPVGWVRGARLWLEPRAGAVALTAYPDGVLPDGTGLSGGSAFGNRPLEALLQKLDPAALAQEVRLAQAGAKRLEARLAQAESDLGVSWSARESVEKLLAEYEAICAAVGDRAALPDRMHFRFRWSDA
jgi:hypothetical protein